MFVNLTSEVVTLRQDNGLFLSVPIGNSYKEEEVGKMLENMTPDQITEYFGGKRVSTISYGEGPSVIENINGKKHIRHTKITKNVRVSVLV